MAALISLAGLSVLCLSSTPVIGLVLLRSSQRRSSASSYANPSAAIAGHRITSCVIGQIQLGLGSS
eukprot:CAMPEP_0182600796 /NCGR_PEP_ID=MMETSP1324-20130603/91163_1 /TAXON_ID=236786 /ORGANISM="Florenciella sp., Strain RCC1587" /LENGTH=65 /DNA_ID=CAMNT_0024818705 /DNA_START=285 /DNA_END=482 /DNA_ORIENTATION=+